MSSYTSTFPAQPSGNLTSYDPTSYATIQASKTKNVGRQADGSRQSKTDAPPRRRWRRKEVTRLAKASGDDQTESGRSFIDSVRALDAEASRTQTLGIERRRLLREIASTRGCLAEETISSFYKMKHAANRNPHSVDTNPTGQGNRTSNKTIFKDWIESTANERSRWSKGQWGNQISKVSTAYRFTSVKNSEIQTDIDQLQRQLKREQIQVDASRSNISEAWTGNSAFDRLKQIRGHFPSFSSPSTSTHFPDPSSESSTSITPFTSTRCQTDCRSSVHPFELSDESKIRTLNSGITL